MCDIERECMSRVTMLMLTMTNDNQIASKFKVIVRILFVFGQIVKTPCSVQPYL